MHLLIFDLDGTLIDSKLDLANSVNATLSHRGLPVLPSEVVSSYVGNGAPTLIRRVLGPEVSGDDVAEALEYFLGYYSEHMLDNTNLYDGVREALDRFRAAGAKMAVLTNKPVHFSRDLVRGLGVGDHFFAVYGGNSFPEKKPHPMGVEKLIEESGARRENTIMVGDSAVDVLTGRNAGIRVVGVTYGLKPQSLKEHPPDILIDDLRELPDLILSGS